jgi:cytochrome P450
MTVMMGKSVAQSRLFWRGASRHCRSVDKADLSHLGDERIFVDPRLYADREVWHAAAARLRRDNPFPHVAVEGSVPFRAATRHADVAQLERMHEIFHNTKMSVWQPLDAYAKRSELGVDIKTLVHMDGKEHRSYRAVTNDWFKPGSLRKRTEAALPGLARSFVDRMQAMGGRCDFAREIALYYPLRVIMKILGVPEADEPYMLEITQTLFGSEDPDLGGGISPSDEAFLAGLMKMGQYFQAITEARRANPTDDVASTLANARIDGAPMGDVETIGYYTIIATAGHDTTSSSLAGGLEALIRRPEQLHALAADPSLIPNAVEEMLRWVTPVRHFMRQAHADTEIAGEKFEKGDWVLLSYLSANRDERVFEDPMEFDIRRSNARDHLAFGIGVHFCLGAHLARMELKAFLEELLPRLEHIELESEPSQMATTFVGGPKTMPIRYELKNARDVSTT